MATQHSEDLPLSKENPCYDCGSTIDRHHTALCDMTSKGDKKDLPAEPGTQWWTGRQKRKGAK